MRILMAFSLICGFSATLIAEDFPKYIAQEIDPHVGNVCYAVTTADVNGDGRLDVVAVAEDAVYWYENPSWIKHTIVKDATERDNVCIQAHDIDDDGRIDFALGAGWQPTNTKSGGTLQWLTRTGAKEGTWRVIPIATEPTIHRIRWGDVLGTGKKQLIVAPLQGRGTKGPNWGEGQGSRILAFSVPKDPLTQPWPVEVVSQSLHTTHNLQITDFNGDGTNVIMVAAWEGVFVFKHGSTGKWEQSKIGEGNQSTNPFKGASEIKVGRLRNGTKYVATIEPWHGFQVVVYTRNNQLGELWHRTVIAEPVTWGHAVWCADLDGDGDDEIVIGQRDANMNANATPKGPGLFVYDPKPGSSPLSFDRHLIDDGGVATEDALAEDLDGDGRPDLIAGGRATHNVKIYWNRPSKQ